MAERTFALLPRSHWPPVRDRERLPDIGEAMIHAAVARVAMPLFWANPAAFPKLRRPACWNRARLRAMVS